MAYEFLVYCFVLLIISVIAVPGHYFDRVMISCLSAIRACKKYSLLLIFMLLYQNTALAAIEPEFFISSPEPQTYKKLDIIVYESTFKTNYYRYLTFPGITLSYGLVPDLEIDLSLDYTFYNPYSQGSKNANGIGDSSISAAYRFLQDSTWLPQIAFMPSYLIPTGNYNTGLGNGKPAVDLGMYAQKTWGTWMLIAGINYTYNTAPLTINYFSGGVRLSDQATSKLLLGVEVYTQGATSPTSNAVASARHYIGFRDSSGKSTPSGDNRAYTLLNAGGTYYFIKNLALQISAAKNIAGPNIVVTYLGLDYSV
jgi:hypothetical protein